MRRFPFFVHAALLFALTFCAGAACAQDACKNHGDLDAQYCDDDGDLVADTPKDPKLWKDPDTLLFSNSPLDDPAVYRKMMQPYVDYLAQCTGKKVRYYDVLSAAAAIEALRSGRMHVGSLSTGDIAFAVNVAGGIPFAIQGSAGGFRGYKLWVIVKSSSPYKTLADLKGKRVAHTTPSSNSGNMAPRSLFPAAGLVPDRDYKVLYSGKHENSILGVAAGDYDAAAVANDIVTRLADRGLVKMSDFRVIWQSRDFPPGGIIMAHDLAPALQKKIRDCTYAFRFTPAMSKATQGADRWIPIDYKRDWEIVRQVAAGAGETYNRNGYEKETRRNQDAAAAKK